MWYILVPADIQNIGKKEKKKIRYNTSITYLSFILGKKKN